MLGSIRICSDDKKKPTLSDLKKKKRHIFLPLAHNQEGQLWPVFHCPHHRIQTEGAAFR